MTNYKYNPIAVAAILLVALFALGAFNDFLPRDDVTPVPTPTPTPIPTATPTPIPTVTATPKPTSTPIMCYVVPGGIPSSMQKNVGVKECKSCGHHSTIPSTWTPCGTATPAPTPAGGSTTVAYMGDARPSKFGTSGVTELTKDLNELVAQSPTGRVDAVFMIGDMDKWSQTNAAVQASSAKNIPFYYVVGNHEITDDNKLANAVTPSTFTVRPGPNGAGKTTYSVRVGKIQVTNVNVYWDGASNPFGTGGFIKDPMQAWIDSEMKSTNDYKVLLVHEPLYPKKRHVGDSLDANKANRDRLQASLVANHVSVVVAAHTHYAAVTDVGGVWHVDAGVSGAKIKDGEDPWTTFTYTYIGTDGKLKLVTKHENGNSWSSPTVKTYPIS